MRRLRDVLAERVEEGSGETVFELGYEDGGEPMRFTRDEWDVAYGRLADVARQDSVAADCEILITKNVGGDKEAVPADAPVAKNKDAWCTGKVLIRRKPPTVEQVIETRIAVVGNGTACRRK